MNKMVLIGPYLKPKQKQSFASIAQDLIQSKVLSENHLRDFRLIFPF